jgi:cysteine desulfurase
LAAAASLAERGWQIEVVSPNESGQIDPEHFASLIRNNTRLACVQLANAVLGTIQPVREIADLCHNRGVPIHCDATQAFGKLPVSATELRVDTMSVSGHKFYGPKGSGAIFVRRGLHITPIRYGVPREMGIRPGAENVPSCIGLGAAAVLAAKCCEEVASSLSDLRDRLINGLESTISPSPIALCVDAIRLPNTVAIEMPGDAKRIQKSARHLVLATARSESPPDEMTRALQAIGRTNSQIGRTLCLSLGWTTSHEQIERSIELLAEGWDGVAV